MYQTAPVMSVMDYFLWEEFMNSAGICLVPRPLFRSGLGTRLELVEQTLSSRG